MWRMQSPSRNYTSLAGLGRFSPAPNPVKIATILRLFVKPNRGLAPRADVPILADFEVVMSTAVAPVRRPRSQAKLVFFVIFGFLTLFVTYMKNAHVLNPTSQLPQPFSPL